jgi:predicted amidophosphoribosyltransferase
VTPLTPPLCDRCGAPLAGSSCASCVRHPWSLARARAAGAYDGSLREIVHAFKYDHRRSLARPLAKLMIEAAGDLVDGLEAAVPVPLHRARLRERGFNQAELLARELPIPVTNLLVRTRATASQIALPAERRARNVHGAFALHPTWGHFARDTPARRASRRRAPVPLLRAVPARLPSVILLVDDVTTTGATLNECARVLLDAGVEEVRALTAARAL